MAAPAGGLPGGGSRPQGPHQQQGQAQEEDDSVGAFEVHTTGAPPYPWKWYHLICQRQRAPYISSTVGVTAPGMPPHVPLDIPPLGCSH
jgi:hypothetical protein